MIEPMMYFGIGFLLAALIGVAVSPLIHGRAVRLTMRRLEGTIPSSMAEILADKDLLRAQYALSTRRLEMTVEQLRSKTASQLAELGRRADAINKLKIEHAAESIEIIALRAQVAALKEQVTAVRDDVNPHVVSLVPKRWQASGRARDPIAGHGSWAAHVIFRDET